MSDFLDNLPVATLTFLAGLALIVVGYIGDDITFEKAYELLLPLGAASGAIGYVRNQAGKGLRKPDQ